MELKNLLRDLNLSQLEDLHLFLTNYPDSFAAFLKAELDKKNNSISESSSDLTFWEKSMTQIDNAEKNLSDFNSFMMELKSLFQSSISENENRNISKKLSDRMCAIFIEKLIIDSEIENLDYLCNGEEFDKYTLERNFLLDRSGDLLGQYRLISFMYGQQLGLSDDEIINKGQVLKCYHYPHLYSDIVDKGMSIKDILDSFYLANNNDYRYLCVRNADNLLTYPNRRLSCDNLDRENDFKYNEDFEEKYSPLSFEKTDQLYDEIIKPYYEKIGYGLESEKVASIPVLDDYKSEVSNFNSANFSSKYEYDLTQQLVNEFLSQKENKSNKQL